MKELVLIFGIITSDGQIDLQKVPNSELKNIDSCEKAIEINRKWVENPNYEQNDMPYGFYIYKNKPIALQYCVLKGVEHE